MSRASEAWFRARMKRVLALALASPALAGCAGDDVEPPLPAVDASLPVDASRDAAPDAAVLCAPVQLAPTLFGSDGGCESFMSLPCGIPAGAEGIGCVANVDLCTAVCPSEFFFTCVYPEATCVDGGLLPEAGAVIECNTCLGNTGRRTRGLAPPRSCANAPRRAGLGEYWADVAYLEEASIDAFRELEARLAFHRAPAGLQRAAARAARDEERHTRVTATLARAHGALPASPRPHRATRASLETLATENAVEGCVRETMGALVAAHQAEHATDPRVARAMRGIARDEERHAALAWALDAWVTPRLTPAARRRAHAAKIAALEDLLRDAARPVPRELVLLAGVPPARLAARIVTAFGSVFLTSLPPRLRCASS